MFVGGEKGSFTLRRQTRNSRSKSEHFFNSFGILPKGFSIYSGKLKTLR